jgi:hypothetical protein
MTGEEIMQLYTTPLHAGVTPKGICVMCANGFKNANDFKIR